jgi:hypothetical protein
MPRETCAYIGLLERLLPVVNIAIQFWSADTTLGTYSSVSFVTTVPSWLNVAPRVSVFDGHETVAS